MAKNSFPAEVTFKGMKMYKITILTTFLNTNRNNGNNIIEIEIEITIMSPKLSKKAT